MQNLRLAKQAKSHGTCLSINLQMDEVLHAAVLPQAKPGVGL